MTITTMDNIAILERLVGFDTTSHKSNIPLIEWVKDYLLGFGVTATIIPDETGKKQALIAQIGNGMGRGIVLNGHTDVVPAFSERWASDPFKLKRSGNHIFGRGTTDMKGFISLILAAVPQIVAADLRRPIFIALSYDEEIGCLGTKKLIDNLPEKLEIIVGEPTGLRPAARHNGARVQTLSITGIPAHSGTPKDGVNAIAHAQRALTELIQLGDEINDETLCAQSSFLVTTINGGGAPNIVPANCEITWLLRLADIKGAGVINERIAKLLSNINASLRSANPAAGAAIYTQCDVPPFIADETTFSNGLSNKIFNDPTPATINFASEAGFFSQAGHNVIVCGPGDMAQGHTDNEFIKVDALVEGAKFIERVIDEARA